MATRPLRRLTLLLAAFVAAVLSCGREASAPTAPGGGPGVRYARALAIQPVFPPILAQAGGAAGLVPFTTVHIVLRHADGTVALDTVVTFPPGTDQVTLTLTVPLSPNAPATGEPMALTLDYVNAAGVTVFHGGPVTVTAIPFVPGQAPPPPVTIPVNYTGPGAGAARVVISPRSLTVFEGDGFTFTAVATDGGGTPIPGTPIVWTSLDPTLATITSPAAGAGVAQSVRGTARIVAQLLTGPTDNVTVQVLLRARTIAVRSGNGQSATVGAPLAQPLVASVTASDGVGVGGVTVTFAVVLGGGSVGTASAITDASGFAQSTWRLGSVVGAQTVTASAGGLTGSPVTFSATGLAVQAGKLAISAQPVSTVAGAILAPIVVAAVDANNNPATAFTGPVTIALASNPGLTTLGGTTTVNAVSGVATFSTLTLSRAAAGYTLTASSTGLTPATTTPFDITPGPPARLVFSMQPSGALVGVPMAQLIVVSATDALGNATPSFTGTVTLAIAVRPGSGTLGGTTAAAAVAGAATFPNVSVNAAGVGYQLSASAPGMTSATSVPFDIALGPAAITNRAWTGAVSTAWSTAGNWSPATVPTPTDSVFIPLAVARQPALSGPVTLRHLYVAAGAALNTATFALTVNGNLDAGSTIVGGGSVILTGVGTLAGMIKGPLVVSSGTHTIINPTDVSGNVTVSPGATLAFSGAAYGLTVGGNLDASGGPIVGGGAVVLLGNGTFTGSIGGRLFVVNGTRTPVGATSVTGSVTVNPGGLLDLNGLTLPITGDFATVGTGTLKMATSSDQLIVSGEANFFGGSETGLLTAGLISVSGNFSASGTSFDQTGTHSLHLSAVSPAFQTMSFASPVAGRGIRDLVFENSGAKTILGQVNIPGNVVVHYTSGVVNGPTGYVAIGGDFSDYSSGQWQVATTDMNAGGTIYASNMSTNLIVSGGTVRIASEGNLALIGNVSVNGSSAILNLNGAELEVSGDFQTVNGGKLKMVNSNDGLSIGGNALFAGGSTVGLLTNGDFQVVGNFTQGGGAPDAYAADSIHDSSVGNFEKRFPEIIIPSASARANARARAHARAPFGTTTRARRSASANRQIRTQLVMPTPLGPPPTITFANPGFGPGSSHFGTFTPVDTVTLLSDVFINGIFEAEGVPSGGLDAQCCLMLQGSDRVLTSKGAELMNMRFEGVRWVLVDGDEVLSIHDIFFGKMKPTVTQFEVRRTGTISLPTFNNWKFETTPTTGLYIKAVDTDGLAPFLTVNLTNSTPPASGGFVSAAGGAIINWPAPVRVGAAVGSFRDAAGPTLSRKHGNGSR